MFSIYNFGKKLNVAIYHLFGQDIESYHLFLCCSKGRQCIPDVNGEYFQQRPRIDPKKYGEYCGNMKSNCHGPVCKYTSEDTNDDIDLPGK